jgi:hypothetical protein
MQKLMRIVITGMVINDQEMGSTPGDHMVSRIRFDLTLDEPLGRFYAIVKQVVGSNFEEGLIEVGPPHHSGGSQRNGPEYDGPFNHDAFRKMVEEYYRLTIGPEGKGLRISGPVRDLKITDFFFSYIYEGGFPVEV